MNDQLKSTNQYGDDDEIDLLELFRTLLNGKWIILLFTFFFFVVAFIYANDKAPVYQADTLLHIEKEKIRISESGRISDSSNDTTFVGTQLEILKSRKILAETVKEFNLDVITSPKRMIILGNLSKRFQSPTKLKKIPLFFAPINDYLNKYAWSHEAIKVTQLEAPAELFNQPLILTPISSNTYNLSFGNEILIKDGKTNQSMSALNGELLINVGSLYALPGTQFILRKLSVSSAVKKLYENIEVSEKGKKTGVINITLKGENKPLVIKTLNRIAKIYIRQNTTQNSEETNDNLKLLEELVKPAEEKVAIATAELKKHIANNQTIDTSVEAQGTLNIDSSNDIRLQQLPLKSPKNQQEPLSPKKGYLEKDYEAANEAYFNLINSIQHLKDSKANNNVNVNVIDTAVANDEQIKPKKPLILALGTLLGGMLGIFFVIIQKATHQVIDDSGKIQSRTGIPVYATIPLAKKAQLTSRSKKSKRQKLLLARDKPNDPAIESLRSLRTSLHFALLEAKNNIVMITELASGTGKSFISLNFSAVIASSKQRVLLIDADMRTGYLHDLVGHTADLGLSDILSGNAILEDIIHTIEINDGSLDIITRGLTPPNPSELLTHGNFEKMLSELSGKYDLILIDTPPVHAFADSGIIGKHVGLTFMVVHSDQYSMVEIERAVTSLSQNGVDTKGFILRKT